MSDMGIDPVPVAHTEPSDQRGRHIALATVWSFTNLSLLTLTALLVADNQNAGHSGTPVLDGALLTLVVVAGLALVNGALLCLSPRTQRLGIGILLGTGLAVPAGFIITVGFALSHMS